LSKQFCLGRSGFERPSISSSTLGAIPRRDCLDHVLIYGERDLRRVLTLYSLYYNETRTHLGLRKDALLRRAIHRSGPSSATRKGQGAGTVENAPLAPI
jgi:hypothetical protein